MKFQTVLHSRNRTYQSDWKSPGIKSKFFVKFHLFRHKTMRLNPKSSHTIYIVLCRYTYLLVLLSAPFLNLRPERRGHPSLSCIASAFGIWITLESHLALISVLKWCNAGEIFFVPSDHRAIALFSANPWLRDSGSRLSHHKSLQIYWHYKPAFMLGCFNMRAGTWRVK